MLNTWAIQSKVMPQDWKGLMSAVLEARQQLHCFLWWRHETTKIEQHNIVSRINVAKNQLLGDLQEQM